MLTKYWLWEDDGAGGRNLAADSWDNAYLETLQGLIMFQQLLDNIQEISDAIEALEAKDNCCSDVPPSAEDTVGIDAEQLPDSTVDIPGAEYPDGTTTEEEAQNAICAAANHVATVMPVLIDRFEPIFKTASDVIALATLFVILTANSIGIALAAVIAGGALITLFDIFSVWDEILELRDLIRGDNHVSIATTTKNEIIANYDEIRNAIACADTPDEATAALHSVLDSVITSDLYRAVVKLAHNKGMMRLLFKQADNFGSASDCCNAAAPAVCFGTDIGDNFYRYELAAGCENVTLFWDEETSITVGENIGSMTSCGGVANYRIWSGATGDCESPSNGTLVHNSNTKPVGVTGNLLIVISNSDFDIEVTWT